MEEARGLFSGWRERTGLHEDGKGGVWLYDYGRGIFHVRADGRVRQLTAEENFPGERVDCFHEDREGNIWAGVDRGGLVGIREQRFSVMVPGESTAAKTTVTVAEDAAGAIWVGTYGGGLHRWWANAWQPFALGGGMRQRFVFSVFPDAGGRLWISAGEEDLHSVVNGNFTLFTPEVHGVKALLRARDGRLWIGRKSGLAVVTAGQFRQFYPDDGVARTEVRALAEAADGAIWAGAGDGTLTRVATNGVTTFRAPDAWGGQPIWSLLADPDGVLWAGTFRGGLLRFANGKFTRYSTKDGFPDDVICQILDDGSGRLWLGSKQGIFHVDKMELQEFAAMFPIARMIGNRFRITATSENGLRLFGQVAQWAGVTTATDLANDLSDANVALMEQVTAAAGYPVRLVPLYAGLDGSLSLEQASARMQAAAARSTDMLHLGRVKIVADGSIQGFTARLKWPGYHNGAPNGIWIQPPEVLRRTIEHFHAAGFLVHVHTNGDEASEFVLDCFAGALAKRIVNYLQVGQKVKQTEEMGFIKFGSRVDLLLPPGTKVQVQLNQVVKGGVTVIATL